MNVAINGTIYPLGGGSAGPEEEIYTTEERRIGTYLGKPLYQITARGNLPTVTSKDSPLLLADEYHVDILVQVSGWSQYSNTYAAAIETSASNVFVLKDLRTGNIVTNVGDNQVIGQPFEFTLKYTKTTDTAQKEV